MYLPGMLTLFSYIFLGVNISSLLVCLPVYLCMLVCVKLSVDRLFEFRYFSLVPFLLWFFEIFFDILKSCDSILWICEEK